jgi:hypothetical protein
MTATTAPQAYIYVSEDRDVFVGRWTVQVIDGRTVYTPDGNLTETDRDATIAEYKTMYPHAVVSWDV